MRNVITASIERFVSFALFMLGIAAVLVAAAALLLLFDDTIGHAWSNHLPDHGFMAKLHKAR